MRIPFLHRHALGAKDYSPNENTNRGWDYLSGLIKKWTSGWATSSTIFGALSVTELENTYANHPVVYACVRAHINAISQVRFEVGRWVDEETWRPAINHWAVSLLENPNLQYNRNDFLAYLVSRLLLTGCSYSWKIRDGARRPSQLWPLPTSWVDSVRGSGMALYGGYKIPQVTRAIIPVEDMLVVSFVDPASTTGYISPLNAAFRDYRLDTERENFLAEMLVNMKLPGMIVRPKQRLTDSQRKEAQSALDDRVGRGKRGNTLVLPGEAEVDIVNPLSDLDWPGLSALIETRLCMALGIPPIIVGARSGLDRATYSNYEQAKRAMYTGVIGPECDLLAAAFTLHLLRNEGEREGLEIRARYDELSEFQEDRSKAALRATQLFAAAVISRDEAREEVDLPADPSWEPPAPIPVVVPGRQGEAGTPPPPTKVSKEGAEKNE